MSNSFTQYPDGSAPRAAIIGVTGTTLTAEEKAFILAIKPFGFILFKRNCETPAQVSALVKSLEALTGRSPLPILIDQEGGRVSRLKAPIWQEMPAAGTLAAIDALDTEKAKEAIYLNARLLAQQSREMGITVNCAPLADVPVEGAHDIIGDRAYSYDPYKVAILARAMEQGLLDGGMLPVLKHIPGHGRATADSHEDLPIVNTSAEILEKTDFVPFRMLNDIVIGMTAHIVYTALDASLPASISPTVISHIRNHIGFDGLLMSDDLSMKALKGDFATLTQQVLGAGCDLVLHCNGKMEEMQQIASCLPTMTPDAIRRATRSFSALKPLSQLDVASTTQKIQDMLQLAADHAATTQPITS